MSDHGDSHSKGGFSVVPLLGKLMLYGVPALMVILLGISGVAFIKDSGVEVPEEEAEAPKTVAAPAAPANPAPPTAPGDAPEAPKADADAPAPGGGSEIDPAVMAMGKAAFANCLACHGADGTGMKVGPQLMAPSLAGSELLLGDPDASLLVVLKGIAKETNDFLGIMAPLGAALDDEKMAAVLTYARNSFGNSAPAVTIEQAAAAREKFADVPMVLSRSKIEETVKAHK